MPIARLDFGPSQASGLSELAGASPIAMNVVVEATGAVRRRPGIALSDIATSEQIDDVGLAAIRQVENGDIYAFAAVEAQTHRIYRIAAGGFLEVSSNTSRLLRGVSRPILAETEMLLVAAAGDYPLKITLADGQASLLGGDPPKCSHIVANALRLVANDVDTARTTIRYSDIATGAITYAGHEVWSGAGTTAGSFNTEANPDPNVALLATANELIVLGTKTVSVYGPDATFVFAPITTLEAGCSAPYSVIEVDGGLFWLDNKRQFVRSDGRSIEALSTPAIANTLAKMSVVSDCYGYRIKLGDIDAICWAFPTDGRTFVLQLGGGWAQWSGPGRAALNVGCHHLSNGRSLIGTLDGYIAELSLSAYADLGDAIEAWAETGFRNQDTEADKFCESVKLTFGHEADVDALVWLEYRDRPGEWYGSIPIELAGSKRQTTEVELRGLGTYRRRQWRIRFDSPGDVVLASAEEQFSVVR